MQNVVVPRSVSSFRHRVFSPAPEAAGGRHPSWQEGHQDHQFVALLNSYRDSGGLARAPEVVALLNRRGGTDLPTLASWIVKREVICLEWQSQAWLPWFQFNRLDMTQQPGLGPVLAELSPVFDPWELASWFAQPNAWLGDRTPAAMLGLDLQVVLNASRADRFIAKG